jgi:hypothetical protein
LTSSQVPAVKVGERAQVSVFGAAGKIQATVSRVGPVIPDQGDVYPLVVALPTAAGITTGTLARISVITKVATRVLVVPTSAVHDASGKAPWVLRVEHGSPQRLDVSVGIVSGTYTQGPRWCSRSSHSRCPHRQRPSPGPTADPGRSR